MVVFLHPGPRNGFALGEHPDFDQWLGDGWAVFVPEYRSSGILGRTHVFEPSRGGVDPDVEDVLTGVDAVAETGLTTGSTIVVGHSYGANLAARLLTGSSRFSSATCVEGMVDLTTANKQPAEGRGPIDELSTTRTPTLLYFGGLGRITDQGPKWAAALQQQGTPAEVRVLDGEGHVPSDLAWAEIQRGALDWNRQHQG